MLQVYKKPMISPDSICKRNACVRAGYLRLQPGDLLVPHLIGRFVAEELHRGVVDLPDDRVEVLLGQVLEPGSFGQIAADPAVPVLVAATLPGTVRVGEVREHAQRLVHQHVQARLRAVVPRAVDARGRRDVLEDLVFGPGRGGRAPVVDEPGEQPAAPALHLRVHAAPRRRGADHRVRLGMAEPLPGSDRLGPVRDGRAHRDARPFRLPALFPRPAFPAARQILAQVYFVKSRWTLSALNLDTFGVQVERRRRLFPCFLLFVWLAYFMRECLFR